MIFKAMRWMSVGLLAVLVCGCATTVQLSSIPDEAEVTIRARRGSASPWVAVDQVTTPTIYRIESNPQFFGSDKTARIDLLFSKSGYADLRLQPFITRGQLNIVQLVELEPLNTFLEVSTVPEGATVTFYRTRDDALARRRMVAIPLDDTISVAMDVEAVTGHQPGITMGPRRSSPLRLLCSASFAERFLGVIQYMRIDLDGYVPIIEPFEVIPGVSEHIDRALAPAEVTLNIRSRPPGAVVEDTRPTGFGKLGETDLQRVITYEELASRPGLLSEGHLILNLRGFKEGHGEWNRRGIEIPLGTTYELEFHLPERLASVTIYSEPAGASVHIMRLRKSDAEADLDPITGEGTAFDHKIHLGTTPFIYHINPGDADALRHGDIVYFEREGYATTEVRFVDGAGVLHGKLDPKRPAER